MGGASSGEDSSAVGGVVAVSSSDDCWMGVEPRFFSNLFAGATPRDSGARTKSPMGFVGGDFVVDGPLFGEGFDGPGGWASGVCVGA